MVRKERLELSHLTIPEPKSGASTNSATFAMRTDYTRDMKQTEMLYRNFVLTTNPLYIRDIALSPLIRGAK